MDAIKDGTWFHDDCVKNFCRQDTLLDWLDAFPSVHNFPKDCDIKGFSPELGISQFISDKCNVMFEKTVSWWAARFSAEEVKCALTNERLPSVIVTILPLENSKRDSKRAIYHQQTCEAMRRKIPIIARPVLHNEQNMTICCPTFLVRRDWLSRCVTQPDFTPSGEDEGDDDDEEQDETGYVIVNQKFRQLKFLASGRDLSKNMSNRVMRTIAHLQNLALASATNSEANSSVAKYTYMLGRSALFGARRVNDAMYTMGRFPGNDIDDQTRAIHAMEWIKYCKSSGGNWTLFPRPTNDMLFPNMKNQYSGSWTSAKKEIANRLKEITSVWHCGIRHRIQALERGISRYDDPRLCTEVMGITGKKRVVTVSEMLAMNQFVALAREKVPDDEFIHDSRDNEPILIRPSFGSVSPTIFSDSSKSKLDWRQSGSMVEFSVDFETISNIADKMDKFPLIHDTTSIRAIGCGHYSAEQKQFVVRIFKLEYETAEAEIAMIDEWFAWMSAIHAKGGPSGPYTKPPRVWHYSHAEVTFLEKAHNCAAIRLGRNDWINKVQWCDLLSVVRGEPMVIRGCLDFGLKSIAKSLYSLGKINVIWPESQVDSGMSAMMACIRAAEDAKRLGISIGQTAIMRDAIEVYLRVDVVVVHEVLNYLRRHHS